MTEDEVFAASVAALTDVPFDIEEKVVITPKGKLSQALTGIRFEASDVSGALAEAKKGVWHSPIKSALLYCFQFNPRTGKYVLAAGRAMQVGAAITVAGLTFLLFRLLRGGRSQKAAGETGHS